MINMIHENITNNNIDTSEIYIDIYNNQKSFQDIYEKYIISGTHCFEFIEKYGINLI